MATHSRRKILQTAVTTAVGSSFAPLWAAAQYGRADLVVLGGTFHTMDPNLTNVDAMAVRGDRILALGSQQDIRDLIGPTTRVIRADGMTITPGFIDAHSHPLMANEAVSVNVDLRRIADVQTALIQQAEKTPPGQWVQDFRQVRFHPVPLSGGEDDTGRGYDGLVFGHGQAVV